MTSSELKPLSYDLDTRALDAAKHLYEIFLNDALKGGDTQRLASVQLFIADLIKRSERSIYREDRADWRDLDIIAEHIPSIKAGYAKGTDGQTLSFVVAEIAKYIAAWNRRSPPSRVLQDEGVVAWQVTQYDRDGRLNPSSVSLVRGSLPNHYRTERWGSSGHEMWEVIPLYAAPPAILPSTIGGSVGVSGVEAAADREWDKLCEKDDRSSPVEYPDMALITRDELRDAIAAAISPAISGEPTGWVLVPREPLPEMLGAWYRVKNGWHSVDEPAPTDTSDYAAYRALIAASPSILAQER